MTRSHVIVVFRLWVLTAVFCLAGIRDCKAADVVLARGSNPHPVEEEQIRSVAGFYGLDVRVIETRSRLNMNQFVSLIENPATVAVLIAEDALPHLGYRTVRVLRHHKGGRLPVMIFGINEQTDETQLKVWAGGAISKCTPLAPGFHPAALQVSQSANLTGPLTGVKMPAVSVPVCQLELGSEAQTVLAVSDRAGTAAPVLVRIESRGQEVFVVPDQVVFDRSWVGTRTGLSKAFSSLAPFALFSSYAAGDYAWHMPGHYANLTIDDAWLTQPYGKLDYAELLQQMAKHNFHTTIAFIPWNFDRSKPEAVALFRTHPDRFSVCLHGNNHAHREFGSYETHSLSEQESDIRQAIARMEGFTKLTGVAYDRFMVFPHGVSPEPTFAALKNYGFLGTANASNVPLGAEFPTVATFLLRTYTTSYSNFLSFSRYSASAELPDAEIAIQAYLGNPVLFYGHADLFQPGIDAFNSHADAVSRIQPDTQWTSLGEIARHSYLLRRRTDGGFDVQMLSSEMDLENPTNAAAVFYIQGDEFTSGRTLTVDGLPYADWGTTPRLMVKAHQVLRCRTGYKTAFDSSWVDTHTHSMYVTTLRALSDFRDLHLSRSAAGSTLTKLYYEHNWDSFELYLEHNWWVIVACGGVCLMGVRYCWNRRKHRAQVHGQRQSAA